MLPPRGRDVMLPPRMRREVPPRRGLMVGSLDVIFRSVTGRPAMPRALPAATRQEIIERHLRGQTLRQVAAELALPFDTVRDLWRAFRDGGPDGLVVGYHACGSATPAYPDAVLRRACRLRREHPGWGAGRVRVELFESLGPGDVPSVRVLQRAFQRAGVNRPRRPQRPRTVARSAAAPHELWQVDAVEKARLKS